MVAPRLSHEPWCSGADQSCLRILGRVVAGSGGPRFPDPGLGVSGGRHPRGSWFTMSVMGYRTSVMVGREAPLGELLEAASAARDGEARSVLVTGEAGIGKSRLVAELLERCESWALVASGHGTPLSSGALPFGVASEMLRGLGAEGRQEAPRGGVWGTGSSCWPRSCRGWSLGPERRRRGGGSVRTVGDHR